MFVGSFFSLRVSFRGVGFVRTDVGEPPEHELSPALGLASRWAFVIFSVSKFQLF